jgi:ketosteroid isomerase-like protein
MNPVEEDMTAKQRNVEVILQVFRAVETRDDRAFNQLCHADVEFHWPKSLPYGGVVRGVTRSGPGWGDTWIPLQPSDNDKNLEPRIIAASDEEVVVHWKQKGVSATGERFEDQVLGLYRLRAGKLARAQMFYFDTAAVANFLARNQAAVPPAQRLA